MKASDVECLEENPYFLSISKGRRNLLKVHRHVDWDMKADFGARNAPKLKEVLDLEISQAHQRKQQARKSQSQKEVRGLISCIIIKVIIDSGERS